jgi:hypothetical protein
MPTFIHLVTMNPNWDALRKEIRDALPAITGMVERPRIAPQVSELEIEHDGSVTAQDIDTILLAHNPAILTEDQQLKSAAAVAIAQGKTYLKRQLLNPAPDVQTIFETLSDAINNNPYLLQMFANQRNLTLAANGWAALDTATPLGRVRYILIAEQVIALLG